jgi:glycosyltransferase involved in cell wall biosynthesis
MIETPHATFHLDSPAPGETPTAGHIVLRGWLVAKPGQHFVDLRARVGQSVFPGLHGFPRPDLAEYFKAREPRLLAAFEQPVVLAAGPNSIVFEACTLAGEWLAVHTEVVTAGPAPIEPASKKPATAHGPDPLRAVEFARALHLLLRRTAGEANPDWATAATEIATALPHPSTTRFAHAPFHGHFDEPAAITRGAFGRVNLTGWLFHESEPIRRVFATFDLIAVQELQPAGDYAGVPERFPQFANSKHCRWKGYVDCPAQLPQPRTLRLYAELADGSWHLCNVQHTLLWDVETEKRGYPRFTHRGFLAATWALHAALRRRGIPTENLRALLPELLPIWRSFRTLAPRLGPSMGGLSGELFTTNPAQSDPRRILLVSHNLNLEGAPLFLAEFAAYCGRNTHAQFTVVTGRDGPLRKRYEQLGATIHVVDLTPLMHAATPCAQRTALRRIVAKLDFAACDLVVANTLASYWAIHAARAAQRPSLFYIHESTTPAAFFHGRNPAALPGIEQAFAAATRVSFLTEATRRYYTAFSDGANYRIAPGWIDLRSLDAVRTSRTRDDLRHRLALAPDERLVVNLGTVCDRKGQILFARAVDLLCRRYPAAEKVRFLMVGARDTHYDHDLVSQLAALNRPNLAVVPESEDAAAFYGAADVFVCSSFEESFPRVILEAMAFSLPIVSSAVHGVPEIVRHDEEAVLVPPGDTWALAEALEQVLFQPAWAAQLGQRARRRLEQTFTTERVQPLHLALARETAAVQI